MLLEALMYKPHHHSLCTTLTLIFFILIIFLFHFLLFLSRLKLFQEVYEFSEQLIVACFNLLFSTNYRLQEKYLIKNWI